MLADPSDGSDDAAPSDSDADGLSDLREKHLTRTAPDVPDTDNDGLQDGAEVDDVVMVPQTAKSATPDGPEHLVWHTELTSVDTDGDGVSDGAEVQMTHTHPGWDQTLPCQSWSIGYISSGSRREPVSVHPADLDLDGDPDILVSEQAEDRMVHWYENRGTQFMPYHPIIEGEPDAVDAIAEDLDGDARPDVIYLSRSDTRVAVLRNLDSGFGPEVVLSDQVTDAAVVIADDLDGDGDATSLPPALRCSSLKIQVRPDFKNRPSEPGLLPTSWHWTRIATEISTWRGPATGRLDRSSGTPTSGGWRSDLLSP